MRSVQRNSRRGTTLVSGSDDLTDCQCLVGYTADVEVVACTECGKGTYTSAQGMGVMLDLSTVDELSGGE